MEGFQPHDIHSTAVNAMTCVALVRSLTACTLQYDISRASKLVARQRLMIHGLVGGAGRRDTRRHRVQVNPSVFHDGQGVIALTSGRNKRCFREHP